MGLLDENAGIILIGVVFNTYLFGLVSSQFVTYYTSKIKDPLWLKAMVHIMVITDTVHSISLIYLVWIYCIADPVDPDRQQHTPWPYSITPIAIATAAIITNIFLGYRIYRLTQSRLLFGFISACALVAFILGCIIGIEAFMMPLVAYVVRQGALGTCWISLQVAMDLLILGILMNRLYAARTACQQTNLIVVTSRLMHAAIQTGTFTTVFALANLITFFSFPGSTLYSFFGFATPRLYTNTLMYTVNMREGLKGMLDQSHVSFSPSNALPQSREPTDEIEISTFRGP